MYVISIIVGVFGIAMYYNGEKLRKVNPELGCLKCYPNILYLIQGVFFTAVGVLMLIYKIASVIAHR